MRPDFTSMRRDLRLKGVFGNRDYIIEVIRGITTYIL